MREITQQQFEALEAEHGKGNVLVLAVEEGDEFAFRRYTAKDVNEMLAWQDDGRDDHLVVGMREFALLCPMAPRAGKSIESNRKLPAEDQQAMAAERAKLAAILQGAQADVLSLTLARLCGYGWKFEKSAEDPDFLIATARYDAGTAYSSDRWALKARPLSAEEYSEYRKLSMKGSPGADDRYAWKVCIGGEDKETLAQRFAFMPIAGGQAAANLATIRGVTLKKFGPSSPAPSP